ncbi:hypothetical protein QM027_09165 [Campylobacter concisus]
MTLKPTAFASSEISNSIDKNVKDLAEKKYIEDRIVTINFDKFAFGY